MSDKINQINARSRATNGCFVNVEIKVGNSCKNRFRKSRTWLIKVSDFQMTFQLKWLQGMIFLKSELDENIR